MTRQRTRLVAFLLAILALSPDVVRGQSPLPAEPSGTPPTSLGPVALYPRFEVTSIGIDTNVFNEAEDPKEDFTIVARPSIEARMRFGPGRLSYRSWMDANYFHRYKDERSLDRFGEFRGELRFTRFLAFAMASGLEASNRPNSEIDLRADRTRRTVGAGVALALLSRTAVIASARREEQTYGAGQVFRGVDLARQLNTELEVVEGGLRVALTPLTTVSLTGGTERSTFEASPERDSTSARITMRFEFDPTALLNGQAAVGYRDFKPSSRDLEAFTGFVADVSVAYTRESTRVDARLRRDLEYSVQEQEPYYVATSGTLTVTRRIGGPFDVQLLGSIERLDYRQFITNDAGAPPPGDDTTTTFGGGLGYRLRDSARLGLMYETTSRSADHTGRPYSRERVVGSLTYGF